MKPALIWAVILAAASVFNAAQARETVTLSITGEDVTDVVQRFNRSQKAYQVVVEQEKYRNWRFAINRFRFKQESATRGTAVRVIDIAFVDNNWLGGMIKDQWLESISGKIAKAGDFINGLSESATQGGKLFALPFSNKGQVLFYRKDLHEKHQLPLPRTLNALAQNAGRLMAQEGLDHGLTIHFSAIHLDVLPFLWSNGGGIMDSGRVIVNHPANVETLEALQKLAQQGVLPGRDTFKHLKSSYANAKKLFMAGKSAYIITWNNRIADFEHSPLAGKFGILPIPPLKEGQTSFSVIGSWYLGVNAFSRQKQGAIEFMNYFYTDRVQLGMALASNSFLPATRSVYADPQLNLKNPYLKDIKAAMANMRHRLNHPAEPQINHVFESSVKEILIEGRPVKALLDIAQERIESIINSTDG